jgi:starch phosphorylase
MNADCTIAYFSMEVGLDTAMPTYSGGLGILAGDTIKAAADLNIPLVAVTLVSRKGYFQQELDAQGCQLESPCTWDPAGHLELMPPRVTVTIEGRPVTVCCWRHVHRSPFGGQVPVFFLDTDLPANEPGDRAITHQLYGGDDAYRLKGEIVLGIGGFRLLEALGLNITKYHLNEGHAALLTLELLHRTRKSIELVWDEHLTWDIQAVRSRTIFTTHTPVAAGHDQFDWDMVLSILGEHIPMDLLRKLGGQDRLNNTLLAMNLSGYINGVAKKHRDVSRRMFAGYDISAVTNGVHSLTWTHPVFQALYDRYIPGWQEEPTLLAWVDKIPDQEVWEAHLTAKRGLLALIRERSGREFREDVLTLGFARRATGYKRMDLILSEVEEFRRLGKGRLQLVFAGKAHPRDSEGKELIRRIHEVIADLDGDVPTVYLANYDMALAARLIPGVDLWLNTPLRPLEASGTSGMKASHNGVPNFSVLDGWWIEGHIEGLTGWSIGPDQSSTHPADSAESQRADREDLYHKLETCIMPLYYQDRPGWIRVMKGAIGKNAHYFNTHRMMRRYVTEAYLRSIA